MPSGYGIPRCRQTNINSEAGACDFLFEAEGALAADIPLEITKVASRDGIEHAIAG